MEREKRLFNSYPFLFFSLLGIIQYHKALFRGKAIGWDSMDALYPTFLYFVDCVKNFEFPFYNPFTLGGIPIGYNFFSSFMLNPIDFLLVLIASVVSPLYIFLLQFPLFAILSGYWIFKYLRQINGELALSYIGGIAYFAYIMFPLAGQSPFFYSFVLFAFLLSPFKTLITSENKVQIALACVVLIALLMKAYFFFIPFFMLAAFVILAKDKSISFKTLFFTLAISCVVYFALAYPVLSYLKNSLADLSGDFISPEPRLRSLLPEEVLYSSSVLNVLGALIDSFYMGVEGWTKGFNIAIFFLFLVQLFMSIKTKSLRPMDFALFFLMVFFIFMSTGHLSFLHDRLPLLRSFRWGFSYIHLSQICYLFFICSRPNFIKAMTSWDRITVSMVLLILFGGLVWLNFSVLTIKLVLPLILLVLVLILLPRYFFSLVMLITIIYIAIFARRISFVGGNPIAEYELTNGRVQKVVITENKRNIGEAGDYLFNDRTWLYRKEPSLNGYNNTIHPIYWYLKGRKTAESFVVSICDPKIFDLGHREFGEKDNVYLENLTSDIVQNIRAYRCKENIQSFQATPQSLSFTTVSKYTLVLQNLDFFGSDEKIIREKRLPGGMRILEASPGSQIDLEYQKRSILKHLLYLFACLVVFVLVAFSVARQRFLLSASS